MFLARALGLFQICGAQKQYGVLDFKDRAQQGARPERILRSKGGRMAGYCDLGMPTQEKPY